MQRVWIGVLACALKAAGSQATTVTLTASDSHPVYNESVTFTATVSPADPAQTCCISFVFDGAQSGALTLANGSATVRHTFTPGTHTVGALDTGDANYAASSSQPISLEVGRAATRLNLSATYGAAAEAQMGQLVTIQATVGVAGPANPFDVDGEVAILSGGAALPGCAKLSPYSTQIAANVVTCNTTFPAAGPYTITAQYSGGGNTLPSSAVMNVTVGKAAPSVYLAASPASGVVYGQQVALGALVMGAANVATPTGTAVLYDGATALGTQPLDANGHALLMTTLAVGTRLISATYSGDNDYLAFPNAAAVCQSSVNTAANCPMPVNVLKANTTLAVATDPAQVGQADTLRATVTIDAPGAGTVGGTVDFTVNGTKVCTATGGTCSYTFSQPGSYLVGASYSGDINTNPSQNSFTLTVGKPAAAVQVAAYPTAPVYGQPVTLSAYVPTSQGVAAPTGTVMFTVDGAALAPLAVAGDGHASLTNTFGVGTHSITANYSGDPNYQASHSAALSLAVGKAGTTVVVSSDPAQVAQPVMLRATVTVAPPGSGTAGGTVDFTLGGSPIAGCTGRVLSGGGATCSTVFPQLATYAIGANYSGDANTMASSASVTVNAGKAVPGVYLAFTPPAPAYGAPVTLNALVMGAQNVAAPTGTVTFMDGAAALGSRALGGDGKASFSAALGGGVHSMRAVYSGDGNYQTATAAASVTVARAATSTTLNAVMGQPFVATVTVAPPAAGMPTGSVQFFNGSALLGLAPLVAQGAMVTATFAASNQSGSITATYLGDGNFAGSTSAAVAVLPPKALVTVTADHNPGSAGQAVAFTVAVSGNPPANSGPPTGTVAVIADGASLGTAALGGAPPVFQATLGVGSHTIVANYSGDAVYAAASGTLTEVVDTGAATLNLTASPAAPVFGQAVTFTARLQAGATPPAGTVQFTDGSASVGTAVLAAGAASVKVTSLAVGTHSITASWAGDATWAAASGQMVETVGQASTATTLAMAGGVLRAAVAAVAPGAGTPTGTVRFVDAATATAFAVAPLAGGAATAGAPASAGTVAAVYSGDANFKGSTSAAVGVLAAANAASYAGAAVAPDEMVALFGPNLAATTVSALAAPADSLGGTSVKITDSAGAAYTAPLLFVSPGQAVALMPADVRPGAATLAVTNAGGEEVSAAIAVTAVAPGLFTADASGHGLAAAQAIRAHADGSSDDPQPVVAYDAEQKAWIAAPIAFGDAGDSVYLVLYGTGIRHFASAPVCTIGGQAAQVLYAGAQRAFAGLDQVNVLLPRALAGAGRVTVILTVDGQDSNGVDVEFR